MLRRKKPWKEKNNHMKLVQQKIQSWIIPRDFSKIGAYLATLTCMHSIVETRCDVPTDFAKQDHSTCFWGKVNRQLDKGQKLRSRYKSLCISTVKNTNLWKFQWTRMASLPRWGVHRNAVEWLLLRGHCRPLGTGTPVWRMGWCTQLPSVSMPQSPWR